MREAMQQVGVSGRANDLPIGAVVVVDGKIVSRGRSVRKSYANQLRHAGLNALLKGGQPYAKSHVVFTRE